MQQPSVGRQNKSITLQRGLYLLSYKSAKQVESPPTATIQVDAASIEPVLPPDNRTMVLAAPGASIVLRVMQASQVGIELVSSRPGGSMEAEFTCEPIAQSNSAAKVPAVAVEPERFYPSSMPERVYGAPAALAPVSTPVPERASALRQPVRSNASLLPAPVRYDQSYSQPAGANGALSIVAHVAKLGDVTVDANEWLAGPSAPARIEGFEIHWPKQPINVSLRYAAIVQGQPTSAPLFVAIGDFAGTRRQARPILGVVFELSGPGASGFEMTCEALFLGSPPRRHAGPLLNLRGPTGREPLVGLRFAIADLRTGQVDQWGVSPPVQPMNPPMPIAIAPEMPPVQPRSAAPPPNRRPPSGGSGRVRVFRG